MNELLDAVIQKIKEEGGITRHPFNSYGISSYF